MNQSINLGNGTSTLEFISKRDFLTAYNNMPGRQYYGDCLNATDCLKVCKQTIGADIHNTIIIWFFMGSLLMLLVYWFMIKIDNFKNEDQNKILWIIRSLIIFYLGLGISFILIDWRS